MQLRDGDTELMRPFGVQSWCTRQVWDVQIRTQCDSFQGVQALDEPQGYGNIVFLFKQKESRTLFN